MTTLDMPQSVTNLGVGVFSGRYYGINLVYCNLSTLTFSNGSNLIAFPDITFKWSYITSVEIPPSIQTIGQEAFWGSYLPSIVIPKTVKNLGTGIFSYCPQFSSFQIEEGSPLTVIPGLTFYECKALKSITFPSFIVTVQQSAFSRSGLTSLYIPKTLNAFGISAFEECASLRSVTFEAGHRFFAFEQAVFKNCASLSTFEIPKNINRIEQDAFSGCASLPRIVIPASCQKLGTTSFQGCVAAKELIFEGDANKLESDSSTFYLSNNIESVVFLGKKSKSLVVYHSMPTYYYTVSYYNSQDEVGKATPNSSNRFIIAANSIPDQATADQIYAGQLKDSPAGKKWVTETPYSFSGEITDSFYAYGEPIVAELKVGDTFTAKTKERVDVTYTVVSTDQNGAGRTVEVGKISDRPTRASAIAESTTGAVTLTSKVTAPDAYEYTVTSIRTYAFSSCTNLAQITIPASIKTIGSYAFYRCSKLRNIFFDGDASSIVDIQIFSGCTGIQLVIFGGKKANLTFGTSSPKIYYTVTYYDTKHDLNIGNVEAKVLIRERARIGSLSPDDIYSGQIPELKIGYEWSFEPGFSANLPLGNSCYVFQEGVGFKAKINVEGGNVTKADCWFKIITLDEQTKTGTVKVGLGKDGITAIPAGVSGRPVLPETVSDEDGNTYTVIEVSDYAFGSDSFWLTCAYITGISFPSTITSIGTSAFRDCIALRTVTLPPQIAYVGESAFRNCTAMVTFNFPEQCKITTIAPHTFQGSNSLTSIAIPANVVTIEEYAFAECYYYRYISSDNIIERGLSTLDISRAKGLRSIGTRAFYNDNLLKGSFTFPEGFTTVGDEAFVRARGISNLVFPTTITSIGFQAFYQASSLSAITFEGDAQNVQFGNQAFWLPYNGKEPGVLKEIYFKGKRSQTITDVTYSGTEAQNETNFGRSYNLYFTVKCYVNREAFNAGILYGLPLKVKEDSLVRSILPRLTVGSAWLAESGFSLDYPLKDSAWFYGAYDLSYASVSGVEKTYYYTGSRIKPVPILSMNGRTLTPGVDYVFDSSHGVDRDGYENNLRMSDGDPARIYLKGIGDYTGQKIVTFEIRGELNAETALTVVWGLGTYTYNGRAHQPKPKEVWVTYNNNTFLGTEGEHYTLSWSNNVNAGTGSVIVRGAGIVSSGTSQIEYFRINKADIIYADVSASEVIKAESHFSLIPTVIYRTELRDVLTLREGTDYRLEDNIDIPFSKAITGGYIKIIGKGNFYGSKSLKYGTVSGGGGEGGGTGSGHGKGPGDLPGSGDGPLSGTGSSSVHGFGLSGNKASGYGSESAAAAGRAGSEEGGSPYNIFGLNDVDIAIDANEIIQLSVERTLIPIIVVILLGIAYAIGSWRSQSWWLFHPRRLAVFGGKRGEE